MKPPTPKQIVEFIFFQPITVGKTLKFAMEKGHDGTKTQFTTLFKFINFSLGEPVGEPIIHSLAGFAANTTICTTVCTFAAAILENPKDFLELAGLDGAVNWITSHM